MKWAWIEFLIVSAGLLPRVAFAQDSTSSPATVSSALGQHEVVAFFLLVAVATLLMLAIGKAHDIRKGRQEQAVELEARVRDAFLTDETFLRSPDCPSVRVPLWKSGPLAVELTGAVPTVQLEQTALRLAAEAVSHVRPDVRIENRMTVGLSSSHRTAAGKQEPRTISRFAGALKAIMPVVGMLVGVALVKYAFLVEHFNFIK
jgi:hypothetical protein